MTAYATISDIEERHPDELILLAANGAGVRDDTIIAQALDDASRELRSILKERYTVRELGRLDADSRALMRSLTIPVALYFTALTHSRSTDDIKERARAAFARAEKIAAGKGALSFEGAASIGGDASPVSPNEVRIDAEPRQFTRRTMRGIV